MQNCHLLAVGIEDYRNPEFESVAYAQNDVDAVVACFLALGMPSANVTKLAGNHATRTTLLSEVAKTAKSLAEGDRLYFYFAGHGLCAEGQNYLVCWDSTADMVEETCVSLDALLKRFSGSLSQEIVLFLDCCPPQNASGDDEDSIGKFRYEDLVDKLRNDEVFIGFGSCQKDEVSYPSNEYRHGIWTKHLVDALGGKAPSGLYENGLLLSHTLQQYLVERTAYDARLLLVGKKIQTPLRFGVDRPDFLVADVSQLLTHEDSLGFSIEDVKFEGSESGYVEDLADFKKGYHRVPKTVSDYEERWIKSIAGDLIQEDVDQILQDARSAFQYKLAERPKVSVGAGLGSITALDFDYQVELCQDPENGKRYLLQRRVFNIKLRTGFGIQSLDSVVKKRISTIKLRLSSRLDLEQLIENIEALPEGSGLDFDYDQANLQWCRIQMGGAVGNLEMTDESITLNVSGHSVPSEILERLEEGFVKLQKLPGVQKLLGE